MQQQIRPSELSAQLKEGRVQLEHPTQLSQRLVVATGVDQDGSQSYVGDNIERIQADGGPELIDRVVQAVDPHEVPPTEEMRRRIAGVECHGSIELPPGGRKIPVVEQRDEPQ